MRRQQQQQEGQQGMQEQNTPFFYQYPRCSIFDQQEPENYAFKLFNQVPQDDHKIPISLLSQLERQQSSYYITEGQVFKQTAFIQSSPIKGSKKEEVVQRGTKSFKKLIEQHPSIFEDISMNMEFIQVEKEQEKKDNVIKKERSTHREPISFGLNNFKQNSNSSFKNQIQEKIPEKQQFQTRGAQKKLYKKDKSLDSISFDHNSEPLKFENYRFDQNKLTHKPQNQFDRKVKKQFTSKNKDSMTVNKDKFPQQQLQKQNIISNPIKKEFRKKFVSKRHDNLHPEQFSQSDSNNSLIIQVNSDFPRFKKTENIVDEPENNKNKNKFNRKQSKLHPMEKTSSSNDSKISQLSKQKNQRRKFQMKKNDIKLQFSFEQPKKLNEPQKQKQQIIKSNFQNNEHATIFQNNSKKPQQYKNSKRQLKNIGDKKIQKIGNNNNQNTSRLTVKDKRQNVQQKSSSIFGESIGTTTQNIKEKKAQFLGVPSRGNERKQSWFVRDMIMLGELGSQVEQLKRYIIQKRNSFSEIYRLEKQIGDRINQIMLGMNMKDSKR